MVPERVCQPRALCQQVEQHSEVLPLGVEVHVQPDLRPGVVHPQAVQAVDLVELPASAAGQQPVQLAHPRVHDPDQVVDGARHVEQDQGQRQGVDYLMKKEFGS